VGLKFTNLSILLFIDEMSRHPVPQCQYLMITILRLSNVFSGNNVIAFKDETEAALTSASSPDLNFIYKQDPTVQPTVQVNIDAARTNAFYIVNSVHDIMYR